MPTPCSVTDQPLPPTARYVAGTTQVRYSEFFAAHFLGTLKVAILDAYLGSLLLQVVFLVVAILVFVLEEFRFRSECTM